jgi:hypothetical protein
MPYGMIFLGRRASAFRIFLVVIACGHADMIAVPLAP